MRALVGMFLLGVLSLTEAQTGIQTLNEYQKDRLIFILETELSKLRRLHNQGKDKMREMEREIGRTKSILRGLCTSLKKYEERLRPTPTVEIPAKAIKPTVSGITASEVRTIVSPIGNTTVIQISVSFSTTETHEVIWAYNVMGHMIPVHDGDPYSSVRTELDNERFTTHLYVDSSHLNKMEILYLKLLSEFSELTILFNKDALLHNSKLKLSPVKLWNELPSPEVLMLHPDHNASITTQIDTNVQQLTTFVNFIGIDTSSIPNKLLDIHAGDSRIQSAVQSTTKGYTWTISLDSSLVSKGGLVSLRTVERMFDGPVLQVHVGKSMYMIPNKTGAMKVPFQFNSVGLLSLYKSTKQTIIARPPITALWCYAYGNPAPTTSIIKYALGKKPKVLNGHVYRIGQYDSAHVVILRNISHEDDGQYLCQAKSGSNMAIEPLVLSVS